MCRRRTTRRHPNIHLHEQFFFSLLILGLDPRRQDWPAYTHTRLYRKEPYSWNRNGALALTVRCTTKMAQTKFFFFEANKLIFFSSLGGDQMVLIQWECVDFELFVLRLHFNDLHVFFLSLNIHLEINRTSIIYQYTWVQNEIIN